MAKTEEKELNKEKVAQEAIARETQKIEFFWKELVDYVKNNCSDNVKIDEEKGIIYALDSDQRGISYKKPDTKDVAENSLTNHLLINDGLIKPYEYIIDLNKKDKAAVKNEAKKMAKLFVCEDIVFFNNKKHDPKFLTTKNKMIPDVLEAEEKDDFVKAVTKLDRNRSDSERAKGQDKEYNKFIQNYYVNKEREYFEKNKEEFKEEFDKFKEINAGYLKQIDKLEEERKMEETRIPKNDHEKITELLDAMHERNKIIKIVPYLGDKYHQLTANLEKRFDEIGEWRTEKVGAIKESINSFYGKVKDALSNSKDKVKGAFESIHLSSLITGLRNQFNKLEKQETKIENKKDEYKERLDKEDKKFDKVLIKEENIHKDWDEARQSLKAKIAEEINLEENTLKNSIINDAAIKGEVLSKEELEKRVENAKENKVQITYNDRVDEIDKEFGVKIEKIEQEKIDKSKLIEERKEKIKASADKILNPMIEKWDKLNSKVQDFAKELSAEDRLEKLKKDNEELFKQTEQVFETIKRDDRR